MKICAYMFFYEFYSIKFRSMIYEMVGWHHRSNGHKFGQTPGDDEGQGALACCSPRGSEVSDMTWRVNNNYALLWAILHMVQCLGLSSSIFFFCMCIFSFFSTICCKDLPFSIELSLHLCQKLVDHICVGLYLTVSGISLLISLI